LGKYAPHLLPEVIEESIELFIEVQAFNHHWFCSSPIVISLSHSSCVSPVELTDRTGGRGYGRGQITKSYVGEKAWPSKKAFNTLWVGVKGTWGLAYEIQKLSSLAKISTALSCNSPQW
jgi:hypothetical protein